VLTSYPNQYVACCIITPRHHGFTSFPSRQKSSYLLTVRYKPPASLFYPFSLSTNPKPKPLPCLTQTSTSHDHDVSHTPPHRCLLRSTFAWAFDRNSTFDQSHNSIISLPDLTRLPPLQYFPSSPTPTVPASKRDAYPVLHDAERRTRTGKRFWILTYVHHSSL
jgi:hypothetical protein